MKITVKKSLKVKASATIKKALTVKAVNVKDVQGTVGFKKANNAGGKRIAVAKETGNITIRKGIRSGTYKVKLSVAAAGNANYLAASKSVTLRIRVVASLNPMKVKGKAVSLDFDDVQKRNCKIKASSLFAVSGAQGKVTYEKGKGNAKISVARGGTVTVGKGLKPGTYKLKVGIRAAGNVQYGPGAKSATATITVKEDPLKVLNAQARAAFNNQLTAIKEQNAGFPTRYALTDLTGDGVDELMVEWWPAVYAYSRGRAVQVDDGEIGSAAYRLFKVKGVVMREYSDHVGSFWYHYLKWNGSRFVKVAMLHTPSAYGVQQGFTPYYWLKGKGEVDKSTALAYVKTLTGGAKAAYATYREF